MPRERQGHPPLSLNEGKAVTGTVQLHRNRPLTEKGGQASGSSPLHLRTASLLWEISLHPHCMAFHFLFHSQTLYLLWGSLSHIQKGWEPELYKKTQTWTTGETEGRYLLARHTLPLSASLLQANASQKGRWEQEIYLAKHQSNLRSYEKMMASFIR